MRKTVIIACLVTLAAASVSAEHLIYGQVTVDGDPDIGAADGARVTLTNEGTGGKCRDTVGGEDSGWWSVDADGCMSGWTDGDDVTLYAKMGKLEAEDSMTLSSGGSQQAPTLTLEEPEDDKQAPKDDKTRLSFLVYPEGSRFGSEPGPYCAVNPLTLRFQKEYGWEVKEVEVRITKGKETFFSFNTGEKTYAKLTFNETGTYRVRMSSPHAPNSELADIEIVDCGYDELCSNGVRDAIEWKVDCGGRCPPCPTCRDGIQNQGELGLDCGGPCNKTCPGDVIINIATTTATATTTSSSTTTTPTSTTITSTLKQEPTSTTTTVPENLSITGMVVKPPAEKEPAVNAGFLSARLPAGYYPHAGLLVFALALIGVSLYARKPSKAAVVKPPGALRRAKSAVATLDFLKQLDADDIQYLKGRFGWVSVTKDAYNSHQSNLEDIFSPEDPRDKSIPDKNLALAKERKALLLTEDASLKEKAREMGLPTVDYLGLAGQRAKATHIT